MKKRKSTLLLVFALLTQSKLFAPPPGTPGNPGCWPPPCVPVDNGVIVLITAGIILGAKTLYDLQKKSNTVS